MIETVEQFELAEEAVSKMKRFLLTARRTHTSEAYAALSAPILLEIQERERDLPCLSKSVTRSRLKAIGAI